VTAASKVERNLEPEKTVILPPAAFADDYEKKPTEEVAIGLRRLSHMDLDSGQREAERIAVGFYDELRGYPRQIDIEGIEQLRNDELLIFAIARACTDPNDVSKLYFRGLEEEVRLALTNEAIRRLWDELVLFTLTGGVQKARATDAEARAVGQRLARGLAKLDDEDRIMLAIIAEKCGCLGASPFDEDDDDDEELVVRIPLAQAVQAG
jgi:hypothetical protein